MSSRNKTVCERIWAEHKYLVLSRSQAIYREIREYLKRDDADADELRRMIRRAAELPEDRGAAVNALQHLWGYFKRRAQEHEKHRFFDLLGAYRYGSASQQEVLDYLRALLIRYPDSYLSDSSLLRSECGEFTGENR